MLHYLISLNNLHHEDQTEKNIHQIISEKMYTVSV